MRKLLFGTIAIASLTFAAAGSPAGAAENSGMEQNQTPQYEQPDRRTPAEAQTRKQNFSDDKLDAYADAALEIAKINLRVAPEIRAADNEDHKKELFLEMQKEMVGAVQETEGLTVQEYNQISMAASRNETLANKIRAKFDDMQKQQLQ